MEQYWINQNGQQSGPFDFEQLRKLQIDDETYVWHSGLDDWTKLSDMPDLAEKLRMPEPGEPITLPPMVQNDDAPEAAASENTDFFPDVPTVPPVAAPAPPQAIPVGIPTGIPTGTPLEAPVAPHAMPAPAPAVPAPAAAPAPVPTPEKCPPTNLVWAIITAVLCCTPLSAVAIYMAFKVKSSWEKGDVEKAKKWSDRGAWTIIASIIIGIVSAPIIQIIMTACM